MTYFENITDFFSRLPSLSFEVTDFIDICLVAFVIYQGIKIIRETRAMQLVKGLIFLAVIYIVISELNMQSSEFIMRTVFQNIFIVLIVLFQQEIRQVIEKVGKSKFSKLGAIIKGTQAGDEVVNVAIIEICKAVQRMSDKKIGSLIVMENELLLGDVNKTGTPVDATVSHELIGNIFFPNSPLHDGAAIIRKGRLLCAGCVLPLTSKNDEISSDLGTRHRAALGMSEKSDAIVIVTSEETGVISVALKGELIRNLTEAELREKLMNYLLDNSAEEYDSGTSIIKKIFKGWKKD